MTLSAGSPAGPGGFSCASCGSSITLADEQPLPNCASCGGTSWEADRGNRPDKEPKPVGSI